MEKKKAEFDMIHNCCEGIKARVDGIGLKGPKSQANEAISYACGFCKALDVAGFDVTPLTMWIAHSLAFQGMAEVEKCLKMVKTA